MAYPNFRNDRISMGYSAKADLKAAHDIDKIISKTNKILKISQVSSYIQIKIESFSPCVKKKQVCTNIVASGIFISSFLGSRVKTAKTIPFGLDNQSTISSLMVKNQDIKFDEAQMLGIDGIKQFNLVQTKELQEVIEVKSDDSSSAPAPSGRPSQTGGTSNRAPMRNPHVNRYRTAPNINPGISGNPAGSGNPGNPGGSGDPEDPNSSPKNSEIRKGPTKEIKSYEFATPGNYRSSPNRAIIEKFKTGDPSQQSESCPAEGQKNEKKNKNENIWKQLFKKTETSLKQPKTQADYDNAMEDISNGEAPRDIGKGGRYLGHGVGYMRKGATRIFYEEFTDEFLVLGVTTKKGSTKNLKRMARWINKLYPHLEINYDDLS